MHRASSYSMPTRTTTALPGPARTTTAVPARTTAISTSTGTQSRSMFGGSGRPGNGLDRLSRSSSRSAVATPKYKFEYRSQAVPSSSRTRLGPGRDDSSSNSLATTLAHDLPPVAATAYSPSTSTSTARSERPSILDVDVPRDEAVRGIEARLDALELSRVKLDSQIMGTESRLEATLDRLEKRMDVESAAARRVRASVQDSTEQIATQKQMLALYNEECEEQCRTVEQRCVDETAGAVERVAGQMEARVVAECEAINTNFAEVCGQLNDKMDSLHQVAMTDMEQAVRELQDSLGQVQAGLTQDIGAAVFAASTAVDGVRMEVGVATRERNALLTQQQAVILENSDAVGLQLQDFCKLVSDCDEELERRVNKRLGALSSAFTLRNDVLGQQVLSTTQSATKGRELLIDRVETYVKQAREETTNTVQLSLAALADMSARVAPLSTKMDVMEMRVKTEISPQLQSVAAEVCRATNEIEATKDRVQVMDTALTEEISEGLNAINDKVEDMAQGLDISAVLNGLAAEAGST